MFACVPSPSQAAAFLCRKGHRNRLGSALIRFPYGDRNTAGRSEGRRAPTCPELIKGSGEGCGCEWGGGHFREGGRGRGRTGEKGVMPKLFALSPCALGKDQRRKGCADRGD